MPKLVDNSNLAPLRRQTALLETLLIDHNFPDDGHHIIWGVANPRAEYTHAQANHQVNPSAHHLSDQPLQLADLPQIQLDNSFEASAHTAIRTPLLLIATMNRRVDYQAGHWPATSRNWPAYVAEPRLEICCGSTPFAVSRYRASTHAVILPLARVGFLDRKLQTISRFCEQPDQWLEWARRAYQASYGYEIRGDQLFLARETLLYTLVDFWNQKFPDHSIDLRRQLSTDQRDLLQDFAQLIAWNFFQMDGLTAHTPHSSSPVPARIADWQTGEIIEFANLYANKN